MIALFVDISGKRIVIFGGGEVAARKARLFIPGADIQVISRSFSKRLALLPVNCLVMDVRTIPDKKLERIVSNSFICIAALSDQEQNDRIRRVCRKTGTLFNNAAGKAGDLIMPSMVRGKNYTVAVSTGGTSPAVARFIKDHLTAKFSCLDEMIALQAMLRQKLRAVEPSQKRRGEILLEVMNDPGVWEALGRSKKEAEEIVTRRYLHG